jgi:Protein of unknown function (DUF669)
MAELSSILGDAFDTETESGSPDFEPLPKGQYVASITDAKVGPLKSGKGQAVSLTWEVEGGRLIWDRVIVAHESLAAMKFGRQKFKDICASCGVTGQVTDLSVLHNKPCLIGVKIETDEAGEFPPKNRVTRVKKISDKARANGGGAKSELNDEIPF